LKNLYTLRRQAGLTQQALADHFHLSQQTIYKYERGHAEPDIETLKKFAEFFGVSVDYLIGKENATNDAEMDFTLDEKELVSKFRKLTPDLRLALFAFVNFLTEKK